MGPSGVSLQSTPGKQGGGTSLHSGFLIWQALHSYGGKSRKLVVEKKNGFN